MTVQSLFGRDHSPEMWRVIPGYNDRYEVSSFGRIRRVLAHTSRKAAWRGEMIKQRPPDKLGYIRVSLMRDNHMHQTGVHQLVALAFLGPCPEGFEVNHIDLDKTNNRSDNLEYVTHAANLAHAHASGKCHPARGEQQGASKLTNAQAAAIRASTRSQRQLAAEYGVSSVAIHNIKAGKTYREIVN